MIEYLNINFLCYTKMSEILIQVLISSFIKKLNYLNTLYFYLILLFENIITIYILLDVVLWLFFLIFYSYSMRLADNIWFIINLSIKK